MGTARDVGTAWAQATCFRVSGHWEIRGETAVCTPKDSHSQSRVARLITPPHPPLSGTSSWGKPQPRRFAAALQAKPSTAPTSPPEPSRRDPGSQGRGGGLGGWALAPASPRPDPALSTPGTRPTPPQSAAQAVSPGGGQGAGCIGLRCSEKQDIHTERLL